MEKAEGRVLFSTVLALLCLVCFGQDPLFPQKRQRLSPLLPKEGG